MKYPDWKNEEDYDFVEGLSYLDWAWEFLRGGTKYRSEFEKFSGEVTILENKFGANQSADRRPVSRLLFRWLNLKFCKLTQSYELII